MLASLGNFGVSIGLPAGIMCERLGSRWTSMVALILSSLGFMLLYSTTFSTNTKQWYADKSWLQDIYFFVAGKQVSENKCFHYYTSRIFLK